MVIKHKGFTLVELLAVIVVLAVILAIAVPNVMKIIDKARIDAYTRNEEMMVNAAQKYLVNNSLSVPVNIGDTIEITLDDLKENKLIDRIINPKDNGECNGYVLVTKIGDNQYDYSPHLNCINDIGSVIEDGLVAHYTFDDFQEPTTNMLPNGNFMEGKTGWNNNQNVTSNVIDYGSKKFIEVISNQAGNSPGILTPWMAVNTSTQYTLSVSAQCSSRNAFVYVAGNIDGDIVWTSQGHRLTEVLTNFKATFNTQTNTMIRVGILFAGPAINERFIATEFQLEKKDHATPFVDGTREGIVKDYSLNSNHASLELNNTPTWTEDAWLGKGAYKFNGSNNYIQLIANTEMLLGANPDEWSYSVWFKKGGSIAKKAIINNYDSAVADDLIGIWAGINNDGNMGKMFANIRGTGAPNYMHTTTSYSYNDNLWHQITVSAKKNDFVKAYIDGIQFANASLGGADYIDNAPLRLGALRSSGSLSEFFDGYIDDVKIYNRALSDAEIKYMYDVEKNRGR